MRKGKEEIKMEIIILIQKKVVKFNIKIIRMIKLLIKLKLKIRISKICIFMLIYIIKINIIRIIT